MIASPNFSTVTPPPTFRSPSPSSSAVGRILPNSIEAEEMHLACCFLDGSDVLPKSIMAGIKPDSFYDTKHATLYAILLDLYSAGKPTDVAVVAEELKKRRELDAVGGYSFLTQVSSRIPTTAQASYFIEKVREQALLRAVIRSRTESAESAYTFTGDIDQFVAEITSKEAAVTANGANLSESSVQDVAKEILADLGKPKEERTGAQGLVSWGIRDIDERCGKLAPGDLAILAGMPSSGKSALADQAAWECARSGKQAVMFSYEMSSRKKVIRIAQQIARMNIKQYDSVPMDKKLEFTEAVRQINACPNLHIYEHDNTVNKLSARCRTIHQKQPVGLIIVDFLQEIAEMEPPASKNERTDERLGRICTMVKKLGRELNCPTIILSSLNREGYKPGAIPSMAHLRSSGGIESKADVVAMLYWPEENPRTGQSQDPLDSSQNTFYAEFRQLKGRDSGVAMQPLMFTRSATRWDAISR